MLGSGDIPKPEERRKFQIDIQNVTSEIFVGYFL
jgi:hypothetical protein